MTVAGSPAGNAAGLQVVITTSSQGHPQHRCDHPGGRRVEPVHVLDQEHRRTVADTGGQVFGDGVGDPPAKWCPSAWAGVYPWSGVMPRTGARSRTVVSASSGTRRHLVPQILQAFAGMGRALDVAAALGEAADRVHADNRCETAIRRVRAPCRRPASATRSPCAHPALADPGFAVEGDTGRVHPPGDGVGPFLRQREPTRRRGPRSDPGAR